MKYRIVWKNKLTEEVGATKYRYCYEEALSLCNWHNTHNTDIVHCIEVEINENCT